MQIRRNVWRAAIAVCSFSIGPLGAAWAQSAEALSIEQALSLTPQSLEVHESSVHAGRQYIDDLPRNLESAYGVGCVLEAPPIDEDRTEPFPSRDLEFVPLDLAGNTTLREFLDLACSEGRIEWSTVRGTLHIRPATVPSGLANYLDTVQVSLELEGASLLQAVKAWALEVNRNRSIGSRGVRVGHPSRGVRAFRNLATPASLTRTGAVTLRLEKVSAREALCAIQAASKEWVSISYGHLPQTPDSIIVFPSRADINATPQVTAEERRALDAAEDLDSVLVAPASDNGGQG